MNINIFKKSCFITYLGIIFGTLSMYFALNQMAFSNTNGLKYSFICLMISGICDMFDGKFARSCKRTKEEKEFGVQLDSLADTFCFLIVPVVIMLSLKLNSIICLIIYIYFIIGGVTRLGYFNIKADTDQVVDYYTGVPVTTTAIIYPLIGAIHTLINQQIYGTLLIIATLIIGFLFNFKIKIIKIKSNWYYITTLVMAIILAVVMVVL